MSAHSADRARALMARPDAWIEECAAARGGGYALRLGPDRRARARLTLDEAAFRALVADPGLRLRAGGGWTARPAAGDSAAPPPGRPGMIEGEHVVMGADGRAEIRRANLGESPVAWLARRCDAQGRPWLDPAEAAAGERLRSDAEIALSGPSLTMRWDALPRSGAGSATQAEPGDRAMAAAHRVEAALTACGPGARRMVEHVCVRGSSLRLAEDALGLRRRRGKLVLKQGLRALAAHYGIG